ncbi:hypothetical protein GM708_04070 [Vibrio cholerae]|jgi:hypothetical protein|nr:hypothetical protein [Vibrio cholerae]
MTESPKNQPTEAEGTTARKVQDDPRAQRALARKTSGGAPTSSAGTGQAKAAHQSSKQGKKEKKVRW